MKKIALCVTIVGVVLTAIGIYISHKNLAFTEKISSKTMEITEDMNEFNMNNANLNYSLKLSEKENCENIFIKSDGAVFSVNPFAFDVIRNPQSGMFFERYFIHIDNDEISLKKIKDNMVIFVDNKPIGNDAMDYAEGIETENVKCPVSDKDMIAIYYSNPNEIYDPYGLFHIVFRGFNNSYQYFTIVVYNPTKITEEKIDNITFDFVRFDISILEDNNLYDRFEIQDIVHKINSDEVQDADDLRNKIEYERNLIKEKIK